MFMLVVDWLLSLMLLPIGWRSFLIGGIVSSIIAIIMRGYEYNVLIDRSKRIVSLVGSIFLLIFVCLLSYNSIIILPAITAVVFRFLFSNLLAKYTPKHREFIEPSDFLCDKISPKNYDKVKRVLDLFTGIILFIIALPIMMLLALIIFLISGGPIIITQKRIGLSGKIFNMYKFRTYTNGDHNKKVTPIGKIIRPLRLDELPQIYNVLKGEMSIVGPRPELIEFHNMAKKHIPNYTCRLKVRPGITGWAQINYKYTTTLDEYKVKTAYDLFYVKNRSFILDLKCVLKTPFTLLEEFFEALKKHIKL
ncbi:MAG: sugar transferase [Kosmotoga sp.]|nr:sugar transferase [Kosmotoga sp.]